MAEKNFSWIEESLTEDTKKQELPPTANSFKEKIVVLFKKQKNYLVPLLILFTLIALKVFTPPPITEEKKETRMEVMSATIPIPKGQIIEGMLLRPATVSPFSLSKEQRLQRLMPEDAEKIMGRLRAKKDIPPNKAIFWSELELVPQQSTRPSQKTTILYPEG